MPKFRVRGTVEFSWIGEVVADDADAAEDLAQEMVNDGHFMDSFQPDEIEVYDVKEVQESVE